jgi:uncharacterized membrane protein (DUF373 family)
MQSSGRRHAASFFGAVEHAFYTAIAIALAIAGAVLFASVVWTFASSLKDRGVPGLVLQFLDGMLLVFILAEIIHTIRTVMHENVLRMEPFLIVGMVAAIRRILVITGEAREHAGPALHDLLLEMGVLIAVVLSLGTTIFLVRHTERSEPHPSPRPDEPQ